MMDIDKKTAQGASGRRSSKNRPWLSALIPMIVLVIGLSILSPTFLSVSNLTSILNQAAVYVIMGIGMTFVIMTGGIDLSQGSLLALVGIVTGLAMRATGSVAAGILAGVLVGLVIGTLNGVVIAVIGLPPFIMTLGTMNLARGLALLLTNASPVQTDQPAFRFIGTGKICNIPASVYIFIAIAVIGQFILSNTATGRYVLALGSNEEAARLSGVRTRWNKTKVYMISGVAVALAAVVYTARLGAAQSTAGMSYEMEAVAATVIGGTSILGGEGGIIGTVIGAVVVSMIRNGMVLLEVSTYWQQIVIGMIIVGAVILDVIRKKLTEAKKN